MVANAGIMLTKGMMDLTMDEWDRVQAVCAPPPPLLAILTRAYGAKVNVKGVFLCYRAAGKSDYLN